MQETRRYDQKTGKTTSMRRKENSADYRYFPDPDLPEIYLSDAEMAEIRASIPALPDERRMRYMQQYGLTAYAAEQLTAERWLAEYFERAAGLAESPMALCNLILGEVFAQILSLIHILRKLLLGDQRIIANPCQDFLFASGHVAPRLLSIYLIYTTNAYLSMRYWNKSKQRVLLFQPARQQRMSFFLNKHSCAFEKCPLKVLVHSGFPG